jgi:hypothetical protein
MSMGLLKKNGQIYEYEGLRAWVNISDINGVLIDSYREDNYNYNDYNEEIILV